MKLTPREPTPEMVETGAQTLPEPDLFAHELIANGGGIWLGTPVKGVCEKAHDAGETSEEVREYYLAGKMHAYAKEYAAAAHAQGLRERIAQLENEAREQALQALASEGQWVEQTGAQQKRIAELEAQRVPLTHGQMLACVRSVGLPAPMGLTRDVGPYEVTQPTYFSELLIRAVERAHGIEEVKR